MKTTIKFLTAGLLVLTLAFISCEKDSTEGPIGPMGPQGEQGIAGPPGQDGEALGVPGPQGEQGPAGAAGTNGTDGNANVITSAWIPVTFEPLISSEVFEIDRNLFPDDVRDSYAILVYIKGVFTIGDAVHQLPADFETFDIDYAILSDNTLRIFYNEEPGSTTTAPENSSVRYVLIEASDSSGKSNNDILEDMKATGIDIKDYHAVMDYLGLDY